MCGRYTLYADPDFLEREFEIENATDVFPIEHRYNIAPSQDVLSIVAGKHANRAGFMRWGLIPTWAKDSSIGYKMINARSETAHEKPSFRSLIQKRRCLIIASGFYEWRKEGIKKQPYYIQLSSKEPFVFAGLWDRWKHDGDTIVSCTILTTKANEKMATLHDRMPVILDREERQDWLNGNITDPHLLEPLYTPYSSEKMSYYPVTSFVSSPKNEGPACIEEMTSV
ncbi:SOS response-associated peptidase [Alteribacter populi]|uniref:SOS response-associated peptidase n=1 Tax=Alteribacter populi TaxID=2011011 RepID=UPI000BBABB72|nr:SOS response-associated peptidase [Alteribacter populi]